jgi:hypothetical protein
MLMYGWMYCVFIGTGCSPKSVLVMELFAFKGTGHHTMDFWLGHVIGTACIQGAK